MSKRTTVFHGQLFDVVRTRARDAQGALHDVEFVRSRDVVRVYAFSTDWRYAYLISERRPGYRRPRLRVISGGVDRGETPLQAAKRELREEAGLHATKLVRFHTSRQSLKVLVTVHHVLALGARKRYKQLLEPLERIAIRKVAVSKLSELVWNGSFAEDDVAFAILKIMRWRGREQG